MWSLRRRRGWGSLIEEDEGRSWVRIVRERAPFWVLVLIGLQKGFLFYISVRCMIIASMMNVSRALWNLSASLQAILGPHVLQPLLPHWLEKLRLPHLHTIIPVTHYDMLNLRCQLRRLRL